MNQSRYTALLACGLLFTACENPIFFFNDTATTEIYTGHVVGSVGCV